MLNPVLENLKIKPLPKKPVERHFFIEKNEEYKSPLIIDKTKEKLIDTDLFMASIYNELNIINRNKPLINKSLLDKTTLEKQKTILLELNKINDLESSKSIIKQPDESINPIIDENKFINIIKTDRKIIIKHNEIQLKDLTTLKDIPITSLKKPEYFKKYGIISDASDYNEEKLLGDTKYKDRIHKKEDNIIIKTPTFYLYNRQNFINFISSLFIKYKEQLLQEEKDIEEGKIKMTCDSNGNINISGNNDSDKTHFALLIHQKLVRDYINLYTPFRGLLLYHGLGSGKTCSSIAIAEGLKNDKHIIVMTPASLKDNYYGELKKCGDYMYKKNQFWEFINTNIHPDQIKNISYVLKLSEEYIKKNNGAWFINSKKKANYELLSFKEQQEIDEQLTHMINYKYEFISYNGLRSQHLYSLTKNNTINPFTDKVIIIDEAHNFISRIVNKINKPSSLSMNLYKYLMSAENCKIILLSGTPIINYPNEIAVLFNILRGYIYTYTYNLQDNPKNNSITQSSIDKLLKKEKIYQQIDTLEYKSQKRELIVTKNPFGFIKKSNDNKIEYYTDTLNNEQFIQKINSILDDNNIQLNKNKDGDKVIVTAYKALPDTLDSFKDKFIDSNNKIKNSDMFKMRIIGLSSYFRSAQEQLMPKYDEKDLNIIEIPMSDFQFGVYQEARIQERKVEKNNKPKKGKKTNTDDIYSDTVSTYRIFSRAFCNYVFPKPDITRPMPSKDGTIESTVNNMDLQENISEDVIDDIKPKEKIDDLNADYELDDESEFNKQQNAVKDASYSERMRDALIKLEKKSSEYLTLEALKTYSPKFLSIINNIINEQHPSIHLIYSQFKTIEGIGILKLALKQNNFVEFKLKKTPSGEYTLDINDSDLGKPKFASYTGSETPEEREIIKNVLNGNWKLVPSNIVTKLKTVSQNNLNGEVIKILMITSSGAEGISLKNVRYVHITEPYWHPVRIHQVIGRARRICSHSELPKELQTVEVFLYLMKFTEEQLETMAIDIKLHDRSKIDKTRVITSDEFLYEISQIKENLNKEILENIKQSSIDCNIHSRYSTKEKINCFTIGNPDENKLMYTPDINKQEIDADMNLNKKKILIKLYKIAKTNYGLNKEDNKVYDYDAYKKGDLVLIGKLIKDEKGKNKIIKE